VRRALRSLILGNLLLVRALSTQCCPWRPAPSEQSNRELSQKPALALVTVKYAIHGLFSGKTNSFVHYQGAKPLLDNRDRVIRKNGAVA
jgi:hypothetical protein